MEPCYHHEQVTLETPEMDETWLEDGCSHGLLTLRGKKKLLKTMDEKEPKWMRSLVWGNLFWEQILG